MKLVLDMTAKLHLISDIEGASEHPLTSQQMKEVENEFLADINEYIIGEVDDGYIADVEVHCLRCEVVK